MKVILLNGSPHANGNTAAALKEMETIFTAEGIETETIQVGQLQVRGCTGCASCYRISHSSITKNQRKEIDPR